MSSAAAKVSSVYPVSGNTAQEQYESIGERPEKQQQKW